MMILMLLFRKEWRILISISEITGRDINAKILINFLSSTFLQADKTNATLSTMILMFLFKEWTILINISL